MQGGAAVFEYISGGWSERTVLVAPTAQSASFDNLGTATAIAQNQIFLSAPYHDPVLKGVRKSSAGTVWAFSRSIAGVWSVTQQINIDDGNVDDFLGFSLAVSANGRRLMASAHGAASRAGALHVFARPNLSSPLTFEETIYASDGTAVLFISHKPDEPLMLLHMQLPTEPTLGMAQVSVKVRFGPGITRYSCWCALPDALQRQGTF
jgi:hypothetical protein